MNDQLIANCYQPLFDHMRQEYDILLTISEMDEIMELSIKVNQNLVELENDLLIDKNKI